MTSIAYTRPVPPGPVLRQFLFEAYENRGGGKGPTLFQFEVSAWSENQAVRKASRIGREKNGGGFVCTRYVGEKK